MILGLSVNANAQQSVDVDGYNYVITSDNTVAVAQGGTRYITDDVITVPPTVKIDNKEYTVTGVNQNAFSGSLYGSTNCSASKIILPNTVTTLQKWAFSVNHGLKTVILSDNIKEIPYQCFQMCEALSEVHMPANLETIGVSAFFMCSGLKNVKLPATFKQFGNYAFQYSGLTSIDIPEGVTELPLGVFGGCSALEHAFLPSTMTKIGKHNFVLDKNVKTFISRSVTPPAVDEFAFVDLKYGSAKDQFPVKTATLYVPEGSVDAYKSADIWKDFVNIKALDAGVEDLVADDFSVEISGLTLSLNGYEGAYQVYAVDGRMVYSGSESSVNLPAKGIYIVKAGKKSVKVAL